MVQRLARLVSCLSALALPLSAQEPDSALARRVEYLERMVDVLQVQVAEQAGSTIGTRSGARLELSGLVLVNGFTNNANTFMDDVPQFVLPPSPPGGLPNAAGTASVRQSRLTLVTEVDHVVGAAFRGELDIDFFGGQSPSSGGRTFPTLRLRRFRADLDWPNVSLMFGQEAPPIVELNPSSLAAVGFPGFSGSGNLWLWLPQVRLRVQSGGWIRVGLEAAALAPSTGTKQADEFYTAPDAAERSRRPFTQGRVIVAWGDDVTGGELSAGAHYGWFAAPNDELLVTKAAAAHARFFVSRFVEIRAEAFIGEGLRGLGGGGVFQNFGSGNAMLASRGGWAQVNLLPTDAVEIGGGYGFDDPQDGDFAAADFTATFGRLKNVTYEGHVQWRPLPLVFGVEVRRMETTWGLAALGTLTNNHINVAAGFEF